MTTSPRLWSAFLASLWRECAFLRSSFWDRAPLGLFTLLLLALPAIEMSAGVMRDLPIAVVDLDNSHISRELTRRLDAAPGLSVAAIAPDMKAAEHLVRTGEAYVVALIPEDASRQILRGDTGQITLFYNASYTTPANAALREASSVVQSYAATVAARETPAIVGPTMVRAPPIAAQTTLLFNPQGSYELQLVGLLHPAILHLVFMMSVVSALGRELRDGTIGAWLSPSAPVAITQVVGKLFPYFLIFMFWSAAATFYLSVVRGWPIAGSIAMIMAGYAAMYLAHVGVALLMVGSTSSMAQSLSLAGLYAGSSFAFCGIIFPIESASLFAQVWSKLLPYTAFARLWSEQYVMGVAPGISAPQLFIMMMFLLVGAAVGLPRYIRAARQPVLWGKR